MRIRAVEDAVGVMLQSGRVMKDIGSNPGTVAAGRAIVDILSRITRREVLKSLRFAARTRARSGLMTARSYVMRPFTSISTSVVCV